MAASVIIVAGPAKAAPRPSVYLPGSSTVVFEVTHPDSVVNLEQFGGEPQESLQFLLPRSERYAAIYFPDASVGWAQIQDPVSPSNPPLVAPIGRVRQFGVTFQPRRRYLMFVAVAKPGRLTLPGSDFRLISVRPRTFRVTLAIDPLVVAKGAATAAAGFAPIDLSSTQASMVAISVDYQRWGDQITRREACAVPAPVYPCLGATGAFNAFWGNSGSTGQDTVGRAYVGPPSSGTFMTGNYELLTGSPFQAARLIAFGLQFNQGPSPGG